MKLHVLSEVSTRYFKYPVIQGINKLWGKHLCLFLMYKEYQEQMTETAAEIHVTETLAGLEDGLCGRDVIVVCC